MRSAEARDGSSRPKKTRATDEDAVASPEEVKKNRCRFTVRDDMKLRQIVSEFYRLRGEPHWNEVASQMTGKTARQCRERYRNYLSPRVCNGAWSQEEEELLQAKYDELGPHWARMVIFFPNRSDVHLKNHWCTMQNRRMRRERERMQVCEGLAGGASDNAPQGESLEIIENDKTDVSPFRLFDSDLMDQMFGDLFCSDYGNWLGG
jgi:hypothetical protein